MMMFADIIKYVEEKEYQLAVDALTPLLKNEDEKIVAKAHHILGYINTRHDYTEKSDYQAKRHLRFNLNSNYPHPYGYVLYSQVEEDSNVALNYLEKGVARFPQDARILLEYFRLAPNKNAVAFVSLNQSWLSIDNPITIFARGLMTYSSVTNMLAIKERNSVVSRF